MYLGNRRRQSLAQMALAWVLKDSDVTSVLVGVSRAEQLLDNIKALDNTKFEESELAEIDKICGIEAD